MNFIQRLFSTSQFMPRRFCGNWTPALLALHQFSDLIICVSYMIIPFLLWRLYALWKQQRLDTCCAGRYIPLLCGQTAAFIFCCGITHLHQVVVFYYPFYRWIGVWSALTALISASVVASLSMVMGLCIRPAVPPGS